MEAPPRVAVALAAALLGFLAVLAARQPRQPSRELRRLELVDLVRAEDARVRALRAEVRGLEEELSEMGAEEGSRSASVRQLQEEVRQLAVVAGGAGVEGPGVEVVLDDSSAARSPTGDPNDLVVHERDIQTVVNALWGAGAEAVAVNGERLTSASAVRCAGNTLLLHGALHSPPYRITAIGERRALTGSLGQQPGMDRLMAAVRTFGLELSVRAGVVRIDGRPLPVRMELASPAREA